MKQKAPSKAPVKKGFESQGPPKLNINFLSWLLIISFLPILRTLSKQNF